MTFSLVKENVEKKDNVECTIGFENVVVGTVTCKFVLAAPILARATLVKDLKNVTENEKMRHTSSDDIFLTSSAE